MICQTPIISIHFWGTTIHQPAISFGLAEYRAPDEEFHGPIGLARQNHVLIGLVPLLTLMFTKTTMVVCHSDSKWWFPWPWGIPKMVGL